MSHIPVLLDECIQALIPDATNPPQTVIDGTLGAGGHTRGLLEHGVDEVLAFDRDLQAIETAKDNLGEFTNRVHIIHDSYRNLRKHMQRLGWQGVDGILFDFGVSSMQFDTTTRGFSFREDAPLDMRFDQNGDGITAAQIVNTWDWEDLADIFRRYGEERNAKRIAQAICDHRPLTTTSQLATLIVEHSRRPRSKSNVKRIHPATRVFQALRIAVNDELNAIEQTLPLAIDALNPGGRIAVISFHSLEDRIVKQVFRDKSEEIIAPPGMASMPEKHPQIELLTRKPIVASRTEQENNPRSRSAKLRIAKKLPHLHV